MKGVKNRNKMSYVVFQFIYLIPVWLFLWSVTRAVDWRKFVLASASFGFSFNFSTCYQGRLSQHCPPLLSRSMRIPSRCPFANASFWRFATGDTSSSTRPSASESTTSPKARRSGSYRHNASLLAGPDGRPLTERSSRAVVWLARTDFGFFIYFFFASLSAE